MDGVIMLDNSIDTTEVLQKHDELLKELENENLDRLEKVKKIYDFITFHNAELFEKQSVCAAGCAHCCKINVDMTEVEAAYIAKNIDREYNQNIESEDAEQIIPNGYCQFLDQESSKCTIYEYRPSVCRMYHVFESPELCKAKEQQYQVTLASAALIEPLYINEFIIKLSNNEELKLKRAGLRDIRQWFK